MRCRLCGGSSAYLVAEICPICDPELHDAGEAARAAVRVQVYRYEVETGRDYLRDWDAFEAWCAGRPEQAIIDRFADLVAERKLAAMVPMVRQ